MKKILILSLILSSILLTSCGSEDVFRIETEELKNERLEIAKKEYSNYKTNLNTKGKIDIKWDGRELSFKGYNCENIIPFYEHQINWYYHNIGYYDSFGLKYGNKDITNDIGIYDGVLLKYNSYLKLNSKGIDKGGVCVYGISLLNSKGEESNKSNEVFAVYKDGIFEYKNVELFEGLEEKKVSSTGFGGNNAKYIKNKNYKYGEFYKSLSMNKNNIGSYLEYLYNVINLLENGSDNYTPHKVGKDGIRL